MLFWCSLVASATEKPLVADTFNVHILSKDIVNHEHILSDRVRLKEECLQYLQHLLRDLLSLKMHYLPVSVLNKLDYSQKRNVEENRGIIEDVLANEKYVPLLPLLQFDPIDDHIPLYRRRFPPLTGFHDA